MDTFLERKELPKLTKEKVGNLNRLVISKEIKLVIKRKLPPSPITKKPRPDGFTGEFY